MPACGVQPSPSAKASRGGPPARQEGAGLDISAARTLCALPRELVLRTGEESQAHHDGIPAPSDSLGTTIGTRGSDEALLSYPRACSEVLTASALTCIPGIVPLLAPRESGPPVGRWVPSLATISPVCARLPSSLLASVSPCARNREPTPPHLHLPSNWRHRLRDRVLKEDHLHSGGPVPRDWRRGTLRLAAV